MGRVELPELSIQLREPSTVLLESSIQLRELSSELLELSDLLLELRFELRGLHRGCSQEALSRSVHSRGWQSTEMMCS